MVFESTCDLNTLSELLKLSPRRVQQLANEGVVHKSSRGKYDLVKSVRGYIGYLNDQVPNKASGEFNADSRAIADTGRANLLTERAAMARIERQEMEGALLSAADVRKDAYRSAVNVRRAMLTLPDRLSPMLVELNDSRAIRTLLRQEISQGLIDVSAVIAAGEFLPEIEGSED